LFIHTLIWIFGLLLLGAVTGTIYQKLGLRRDSKIHPPPGRLIDVGTHRLHVLEKGQGSPTIVLEAGLMSTVLSWSEIQRTLARSYRVVSYDRAGLGWSDLGPMPRTSERMVTELHTLLERAAIPPPYVLVGHSFGGLTMPLFAARYPQEAAGVVLVDPVTPGRMESSFGTGPEARASWRPGISPRCAAVPHRHDSLRGVVTYFRRNEASQPFSAIDQPRSAR
jgi:pimeloyl-ACP methyl ester carboxylesterase